MRIYLYYIGILLLSSTLMADKIIINIEVNPEKKNDATSWYTSTKWDLNSDPDLYGVVKLNEKIIWKVNKEDCLKNTLAFSIVKDVNKITSGDSISIVLYDNDTTQSQKYKLLNSVNKDDLIAKGKLAITNLLMNQKIGKLSLEILIEQE